MEYIKLKYYGKSYSIVERSKTSIDNLAYFLTDDVRSDIFPFKEWLNIDELEIQGNYAWLEKWENDILIGFLFDSEEDMYKYAFSIPKDEFLKTLKLWQKLYEEKPNEIHITYQNGKITMEGKN